ncbi:MAG TPA: hypothetical protein VI299_10625 [Polyangiales bacterium]
MLRRILTVGLLFSTLLCARTLAQDEPPPDPVRTALIGYGCAAQEVLAHAQRWYAACGAAGVFVVELRGDALELVERRRVGGVARAVYVREDQIWVESTSVQAHPLDAFPLEGATSAPPPPPPPTRASTALPPPMLRPVEPKHESRLFPSRVGGVFGLEISVRPLLPIETRGFAMIGELALSYVGERHWFAQVRGFPLGGLLADGRDTPLMGAIAQGGYDHPYFALGLGVGALLRGSSWDDWSNNSSVTSQSTRFAISQYGRLGATDGLHLAVQNVFVLLEQWKFGMVDARVQVPLTRATWLSIAGGGGEQAGFYYAEIGLRLLLRGDRRSGSLFGRPSLGVAGVDQRGPDFSMRSGPMVGMHLEWRK